MERVPLLPGRGKPQDAAMLARGGVPTLVEDSTVGVISDPQFAFRQKDEARLVVRPSFEDLFLRLWAGFQSAEKAKRLLAEMSSN